MRITYFNIIHDIPVNKLSTDDYLNWRSYIIKQGLSIRTLNWLMKLLKELLNYPYKWHDINNRHLYNRLENFVDADALPEETLNTYSHLYENKLKEITNIIDNLDI